MEWIFALLVMLGVVCVQLVVGMPVAFAFLAANVIGAWLFLGGIKALATFPQETLDAIGTFSLTPIPMFILMGELLFHTGVAMRAIDAIDRLIVKLPGRLAVVSLLGGTSFASLSGSTIASTALIGNTMLPKMIAQGYDPKISMGSIMSVGGIAMLIPPSALAVLLASLAEQSISALLIAGIIPALLMAIFFLAYVILRCHLDPSLAPNEPDVEGRQIEWRPIFIYVLPLFAIFAAVLGSMFGGFASATEAAAIGCVATAVVCACYRKLTIESLRISMLETAKISGMILFIVAGSLTFSQILAVSGGTSGLLRTLDAAVLSQMALVLIMLAILLVLGCFMDQISMILLTLPFFVPLALANSVDMTWLMLLILVAMEISLLTPPFGLLLFVMKGVAPTNISLTQVYGAALPFVGLKYLVLAILLIWPEIATWLPNLILGRGS
ncbi:TRAP transporter large permease subunit [Seohaeicola saemankumensis]|uniref:TRAP transporter large permease n=1 Tax=Seohaeicola TaxID=481178 RepID=UPI0035CF8630